MQLPIMHSHDAYMQQVSDWLMVPSTANQIISI